MKFSTRAIEPIGKAFLVEGQARHKKYAGGGYKIKFSPFNTDDSGRSNWIIAVELTMLEHVSAWQCLSPPSIEVARMLAETALRCFPANVQDELWTLERIQRLSKTKNAKRNTIFIPKGGWGEGRKDRMIDLLKDMEFISKKGKSGFRLTESGKDRMTECRGLILQYGHFAQIAPADDKSVRAGGKRKKVSDDA